MIQQVIYSFSYTGLRRNEDENQEKLKQHIPDSKNINQGDNAMTRTFREDLEQKLQDPEFAKMFGAAQAKSSFAITLAETRMQLNLTQQQLAARLGVSQAYISKLEGGEANPTLERIGSLLATLGLKLTTDVTSLSPYPAAPIWEIYWPSDAWLIPPSTRVSLITGATEAKGSSHIHKELVEIA
jgi:transcriptional regulator with XRE-family HTH domain